MFFARKDIQKTDWRLAMQEKKILISKLLIQVIRYIDSPGNLSKLNGENGFFKNDNISLVKY